LIRHGEELSFFSGIAYHFVWQIYLHPSCSLAASSLSQYVALFTATVAILLQIT
jgi:hypothetical protein